MWKIVGLALLSSSLLLCSATEPSGYHENDVIGPQHRLINEMNQNFSELEKASEKLIDLGAYVGKHKVPPKTVKITNTVAVKVPVPYPVQVPHPVPVPVPVDRPVPLVVPKLVRIPEPTATVPAVTPAPVNYVTLQEQEVAHSNTNAQVQEFVHSLPIHSVYDVGMDYNPVMGNRLAVNKPRATEHRPNRHLGEELDKLNEYSAASTRYSTKQNYEGEFRSTANPEESGYHKYYPTAQPEPAASAGYEFKFSSPHPEVVPHSYKEPKSLYYSKDDKYPTPKFPRPTHSAYPTNPTFQTKDPSYGQENDFRQYNFKTAPTPPSYRHTSIKDSYPHYEQPDFKQYHYQKPSVDSESYVEHQPKHTKYIEHYEKPSGSDNGYVEHREAGESSAVYKQYEQHSEPSYEGHQDLYGKPSANPEIYSHYEPKEPQQEYKTYYAKPTPVSEALAYLDKQPSHGSEQKVYFHKPMTYQVKAHKAPHKSHYSSESSDLTYNFPSDSHLHPTYADIESPKHKHHPYFSSTPEHPSFDEESAAKYYHHPSPSPSPAPSNHHVISYNPASEQYQRRQHHYRHSSDESGSAEANSDMLQSASKAHEAYERAVELKHRAANPREYSMYSVEHLHHHHGDVNDDDDEGRDYQ